MKVKTDTIARTIVLAIALINQILVTAGAVPLGLSESTIYELCSLIATVITAVIAWWKNNSFTRAALIGDKEKERVKEWQQHQ